MELLVWTVFDNEPCVDERLLGSERVVVAPHVGAAGVETMVDLEFGFSTFGCFFSELRDKG